jgi:hypothetical protein
MIRKALATFAVAAALVLSVNAYAQDAMQSGAMKSDSKMAMHSDSGKPLETGQFHGKVHSTSGRATIYGTADGNQVLRLTHFKTSNGPDVHVLLIAASDAMDNDNFLDKNIERVELGKLKGNEGDQNYDIPAGTDLSKFKTVAIYCERFNANFGVAPLARF